MQYGLNCPSFRLSILIILASFAFAFAKEEALAAPSAACQSQYKGYIAATNSFKTATKKAERAARDHQNMINRRERHLKTIANRQLRFDKYAALTTAKIAAADAACIEQQRPTCPRKSALESQLKRATQLLERDLTALNKTTASYDRRIASLHDRLTAFLASAEELRVRAADKEKAYGDCESSLNQKSLCELAQTDGASTLIFDDIEPAANLSCGLPLSSCGFGFKIKPSGFGTSQLCADANAGIQLSSDGSKGVKLTPDVALEVNSVPEAWAVEIIVREPAFVGVCGFCGMLLYVNGQTDNLMTGSFRFYDQKTLGGANIRVYQIGEEVPGNTVDEIARRVLLVRIEAGQVPISSIKLTGEGPVIDSIKLSQ